MDSKKSTAVSSEQHSKTVGIVKDKNNRFEVWVLTPIGHRKDVVARGLSKGEAIEREQQEQGRRERIIVHLRDIRREINARALERGEQIIDFAPIVE